MRARDPIICQLLPDVEYFLGLIVGQYTPVPLSGVKQCKQNTLIAVVGKNKKMLEAFKTNVLCGTVELIMCHSGTTYVALRN